MNPFIPHQPLPETQQQPEDMAYPPDFPDILKSAVEISVERFRAELTGELGAFSGIFAPRLAGFVERYRAEVRGLTINGWMAGKQ